MDISSIFEEVSVQMRNDFNKAQKALTHPGLKGDAYEEVVRTFLRQYLPKNLDITQGMVVDSEGKQSRQLDVIVCDMARTPIFFQSGHTRVIPAECVYAVIEIKAFLDKTELEKSYQNMRSIKTLSKKAYFNSSGPIINKNNLYGQEWEHWPTHFFVFAYDSNSLESVKENLNSLQLADPVHQRIDTICVLDKGVILNRSSEGYFQALPTINSQLVYSDTKNSLLLFYTLISIVLNQARMNPFNLHPYINGMSF